MLLCVFCGLCVEVGGNCGVLGYCVRSGCELFLVVWGVVVICYGLLCGEWW